jgi:hypothetical protein
MSDEASASSALAGGAEGLTQDASSDMRKLQIVVVMNSGAAYVHRYASHFQVQVVRSSSYVSPPPPPKEGPNV